MCFPPGIDRQVTSHIGKTLFRKLSAICSNPHSPVHVPRVLDIRPPNAICGDYVGFGGKTSNPSLSELCDATCDRCLLRPAASFCRGPLGHLTDDCLPRILTRPRKGRSLCTPKSNHSYTLDSIGGRSGEIAERDSTLACSCTYWSRRSYSGSDFTEPMRYRLSEPLGHSCAGQSGC